MAFQTFKVNIFHFQYDQNLSLPTSGRIHLYTRCNCQTMIEPHRILYICLCNVCIIKAFWENRPIFELNWNIF